jgi:hypothetical protein
MVSSIFVGDRQLSEDGSQRSHSAWGYYLIQEASGGQAGAQLPAADVTGTINASAAAEDRTTQFESAGSKWKHLSSGCRRPHRLWNERQLLRRQRGISSIE